MSQNILHGPHAAIPQLQNVQTGTENRPVEKLISTKEVCFLYGISLSTLWRWVKAGLLPSPLRIGRRTFWVGSMLQNHIADLKARHA